MTSTSLSFWMTSAAASDVVDKSCFLIKAIAAAVVAVTVVVAAVFTADVVEAAAAAVVVVVAPADIFPSAGVVDADDVAVPDSDTTDADF